MTRISPASLPPPLGLKPPPCLPQFSPSVLFEKDLLAHFATLSARSALRAWANMDLASQEEFLILFYLLLASFASLARVSRVSLWLCGGSVSFGEPQDRPLFPALSKWVKKKNGQGSSKWVKKGQVLSKWVKKKGQGLSKWVKKGQVLSRWVKKGQLLSKVVKERTGFVQSG